LVFGLPIAGADVLGGGPMVDPNGVPVVLPKGEPNWLPIVEL